MVLISENPYYVSEGDRVKLKCQLYETKAEDDTIIVGIRKEVNSLPQPLIAVEYNKSSQAIVWDNGDVKVDNDSFTFTLNGTVEAGGFYSCFYLEFPNLGASGTIEVVIQGT